MSTSKKSMHTIPGMLTSQLQDLDLSRKELASMLGVSVRTIHNIEYGRKRVAVGVLKRLANILNQRSAMLYSGAEPLALTEHHFAVDPMSAVNVAMQAIVLNRADLLSRDHAQVVPNLRWWINGNPDRLAWSGLYDLKSLGRQIDCFHNCFQLLGVDEPRMYITPRHHSVVLRTVSHVAHLGTQAATKFESYIEFDVTGAKLRSLDSTFDTSYVTTFYETGVVPRSRK
ncbi:MAG: helix-turn-helix transcriptional regulator [Planctomycetales bacterium]|nr:helix-turn-helix transcriptional regulator [Planctomycetales bacterium]